MGDIKLPGLGLVNLTRYFCNADVQSKRFVHVYSFKSSAYIVVVPACLQQFELLSPVKSSPTDGDEISRYTLYCYFAC